jgi:hypothetical protein
MKEYGALMKRLLTGKFVVLKNKRVSLLLSSSHPPFFVEKSPAAEVTDAP